MIEFTKKLFQCFFCWLDKIQKELKKKNMGAIIAFSFGGKNSEEYGESNKFLASKIIPQFNTCPELFQSCEVIAQWEIANQLHNCNLKTIHPSPKKYLDTYEVARQAYVICKNRNINQVFVVAHPDHALRCKWTLEKLGLSVGIIDTSGCPYDSSSNQIWTRSRALFIPREILARLMYLVKGYI